ncbi:MAG: FAD-binding protein [Candidatus Latescibacteria bacterium]|nr:FAD-binding protein [Candidatus Latescibacterota bacterium]NIO57327.1 FAD-binding protein [Candidatus Latescibacterota bacterium]
MDGSTETFARDAIDEFAASLRGELLTPDADRYDEARSIWNAMVDRKPGMIVECAGAVDVIRAVNFARENQLLVSVRGIGHNIAGNSVCDGGIMIDLSKMKSVRIDADNKRARVEPGVTLGDLDNETQAFGLATPIGINSTTGVAGLTLGGGFGWLSRKHGLTIDNLVSADVVTAAGELVKASKSENSDLFWGIRGGGGNFGIVTSFEFELHPVGPEVLAGLIVHPIAAARDVLRYYRDFCAQAPDELTVWVVLRKAPPLPFLPEEVHGTEVVVLAAMYAGDDMAEGEKALAPLREHGNPIADVIGPHTFVDFQSAFDPLLTPGFRNYWKSHDFAELSDEALDTTIQFVDTLPSPHCEIFIAQMGGATNRIPKDATAYHHRDAEFIMNVHGRWENEADDDRCTAWCRELFEVMTPYSTGGVYVNFMTQEEEKRVKVAYGDSYDRLVALKNKYDPTNFFRLNQNIQPSV